MAPDSVSPDAMTSCPPRISLAMAASSSRSHCRSADSRSARRQVCGSARCLWRVRSRGGGPRLGHQTVGKAHPQRLGAADRASGQNEVDRLRMTDQARQPDGAEIDQRHAEAAAEDAEGGVLGNDAHVGPQRQFHAAGHCKTLDRRDHGLRQPQPARSHRRDVLWPPISRFLLRSPTATALRSAPAQK